ncbi:MAG: rod-binding protein [Lentisphaeria bacterium]|nr:rod-binding protein [Lentisphaeria bacterium]
MEAIGWIHKTIDEAMAKVESPKVDSNDMRLREVSVEFEAQLTKALLKESLKSAEGLKDDDESSSSGSYSEMVYDQLAGHISKQNMLGLADTIYDQLKQQQLITGQDYGYRNTKGIGTQSERHNTNVE